MDIEKPPQPKGSPKGKGTGPGASRGTATRQAYWVSLSARDDAEPFGVSRGAETLLNARGKALASVWAELATLREGVEADALAIGKLGLEGILILRGAGGKAPELGPILRFFKVISSLRLAQAGKTASLRNAAGTAVAEGKPKAPAPLWKKGYAEKSLADAASLARARRALKRMQAR
jgi:hypothetical protein